MDIKLVLIGDGKLKPALQARAAGGLSPPGGHGPIGRADGGDGCRPANPGHCDGVLLQDFAQQVF